MSGAPYTALSDEARNWLLDWARRSIRVALTHEHPHEHPGPPTNLPAGVETPRACFVSLHTRDGELRGCIGTFDDSEALWRNVGAMALSAATRDHRFAPLTFDELDNCVIEISALTPRVPIRSEDVVVGQHGLWIMRGGHHGVLLPQVAVSYGWDRETFLEHTCMKAGLARNAWHEAGTSIEAFGAEVFGEAHEKTKP